MLTAEAAAPAPAQIEKANFLNLMIVDDERSIREACREVGQILGFNTFVADSAEHAYRTMEAQPVDWRRCTTLRASDRMQWWWL